MKDRKNGDTRRQFLRASASAALALGACSPPPAAQPHILWIIAEDFCPELGCYGNKLVRTPNIDRLASEGVRFTQAIATSPVCSTARSALMTGMYQTSIGAHHHRSHRDDGYRLPGAVRPFTHLLRDAGYHTSNLETGPEKIGGTGKTDFNFQLDHPFDGDDWSQRAPGQPFYAQINFSETHRAFQRFPERPIDPQSVQLPPYYPDHPVVRQDWALYLETAQHLDAKVGKVLARLEAEGLAGDTMVFFFADHGRPMPRGKQFLYEGGIHVPLIVRIPEKLRPEGFEPGTARDDLVQQIDITATTLEWAGVRPPAWIEGQVFLGSRARRRQYAFSARDRCDETVDRIRSVRTQRFKLIRNYDPERPYTQMNHYKETSYPGLQVMRQLHAEGKLTLAQSLFLSERRPEEELYDLEGDPYEIQNLAGSPDHEAVREELRAALDEWIERTGDQGAEPEGKLPEEYKWRTHADGWVTRGAILEKTGAGLRCEWSGKRNQMTRPYVAEAGEFEVQIRARSREITPQRVIWGVADNVRGNGNEAPVELPADGAWHQAGAAFRTDGWLVNFQLDFGEGRAGVAEIHWVRLYRLRGPNRSLLAQWPFTET